MAKAFFVILVTGMGMLLPVSAIVAEQAGRLPRVGVLWPGLVDEWVKAFSESLRANGYVNGATAVVDVHATGGNFESGPRLAELLIAADPDVVFAVPGAFAKDVADAEAKAGKQIPIVLATSDPIAEGLVASVARPGPNITGVAVAAPGDLATKHLQLLKELLPHLKRIACLVDTTWYQDVSLQTKAALERAGLQMGVRVISIDLTNPDNLDRSLSEVTRKRADALIIPPSAVSLANRSRIIAFAAKHRLPAVYWEEVFTNEGGLMSYGSSAADTYRRAAAVVAKILHGAKPADIPVDYSIRFRLVLNLRTAKALRLPIPQSVLIRADEVIR